MIARWRTLSPYWRRTTLRLALLPLVLFLLFNALFLLLEVVYEPDLSGPFVPEISEARLEALREEFGLNDSTWQKYQDFWRNVVTFDFGTSMVNRREIGDNLRARWSTSAQLLVMSAIIAGATATSFALISRSSPRTATAVRVIAAVVGGAPLIAVAVSVLVYPLEWWGYLPPDPLGTRIDFTDDPWGNLRQFAVPSAAMGVIAGAWSSRVPSHVLAGVPVSPGACAVAASAAVVDASPVLLAGLLAVEQVFALPGLGEFFYRSIVLQDVDALTASGVILFLVASLLWAVRPVFTRASAPPHAGTSAYLRANRVLAGGLAIAGLFVLLGLLGPWLAPFGPNDYSGFRDENPSWAHWLGTQRQGRDMLSLMLYATHNALQLASLVVAFGAVPGALAGWGLRALAARIENGAHNITAAFIETSSLVLSLPSVPFALLFLMAFGLETSTIVAVLALLAFSLGARAVLTAGSDAGSAVTAAAGATATCVAGAIAAQTYLSFLGLYPDGPTWGAIIVEANQTVPYHYIVMLAPTVAVTTFTAGFLLIRTALDDLDPPRLYER